MYKENGVLIVKDFDSKKGGVFSLPENYDYLAVQFINEEDNYESKTVYKNIEVNCTK